MATSPYAVSFGVLVENTPDLVQVVQFRQVSFTEVLSFDRELEVVDVQYTYRRAPRRANEYNHVQEVSIKSDRQFAVLEKDDQQGITGHDYKLVVSDQPSDLKEKYVYTRNAADKRTMPQLDPSTGEFTLTFWVASEEPLEPHLLHIPEINGPNEVILMPYVHRPFPFRNQPCELQLLSALRGFLSKLPAAARKKVAHIIIHFYASRQTVKVNPKSAAVMAFELLVPAYQAGNLKILDVTADCIRTFDGTSHLYYYPHKYFKTEFLRDIIKLREAAQSLRTTNDTPRNLSIRLEKVAHMDHAYPSNNIALDAFTMELPADLMQ